nr:MAG: hypothetical protein [Microvirus sp.]
MASDRRKRDRRRSIAARRSAEIKSAAGIGLARKPMAKPPAPVAKTLAKIARRKPAPIVVDFKTKPLPAAAKAGALTSKVKPARQAAVGSISMARRSVSAVPKKQRSIVLPARLSAKLATPAKALGRPSSQRIHTPAAQVKTKQALPGASLSPLHDPKTKKGHSENPRKEPLTNTCKPRPKNNKPSPSGGSRAFVPWCG